MREFLITINYLHLVRTICKNFFETAETIYYVAIRSWGIVCFPWINFCLIYRLPPWLSSQFMNFPVCLHGVNKKSLCYRIWKRFWWSRVIASVFIGISFNFWYLWLRYSDAIRKFLRINERKTFFDIWKNTKGNYCSINYYGIRICLKGNMEGEFGNELGD